MTLIEISIALVVVGLLFFVAVPSVEALVGVRAREEAGRIAGSVRSLYGTSALFGRVCRLVFDLDAREYWPECTTGRFTVEMERSSGGERIEDEKAKEKEEEGSGDTLDEVEAMKQRVSQKSRFTALEDEDVPRRKLPDGAELSVWVAHQTERYTKGRAFLYFFPQGHTEKAQLYVSSGHGTVYTIAVSPLNGRVRVVDEELEVPRS